MEILESNGMNEVDVTDLEAVLERIRAQTEVENIRVTQHAQQEMVEEDIMLYEVLKPLPQGKFWKTIPSIVEEAVVCLTVLPMTVVPCTSCVQRHDQC